ncbi:MAG: HAD family hydrolase [Dorea sp.]|nr:HAD family hydrolase [Dorea sp.]
MIKAILFDVDDTLFSQSQAFERAYGDLIKGKYDVDCETLFRCSKKHLNSVYHLYMEGKMTKDQLSVHRMQKAMNELGFAFSEEQCLEYQKAYDYYQTKITLTDTIKEMLTALKEKYTLGIITNGISSHQKAKMKVLGLTEWVDEDLILVSGDTEFAKPDPRLFKIMEERIGFAPEEFLYVGDALVNDMQGAKSAGWNTLYLNRRDVFPEPGDTNVDDMVMTEEELKDKLLSL